MECREVTDTNESDIIQTTAEAKSSLLADLITFTQVFYKLRTGRDFAISQPIGRESHYKIISRALGRVFRGECNKLIINIPPRYGKTTMLMNFVAWSLARYPDSNFLYVSLSHELASLATSEIRNIITSPYYKSMFNVRLKEDSQAKDAFITTNGGSITAVGSGGTITGRGAGLRGVDRFGGIICIDDIIKPSEAGSDIIRNGINEWFYNTLLSRRNAGEKTPIVFIGQRTHEDDLAGHLLQQKGWDSVILPAIDPSNNAICPELMSIQELKKLRDLQPYVFNSQYQQNPTPPGGSLFKAENFPILNKEPEILMTFLTVDTAETSKEINDATVFSLWGVYPIEHFSKETDLYALHWLNCVEIFVEPKDLQAEFMQFYASAAKHKLPSFVCIEKKSTGVTLVSVLSSIQGLNIIAVDRTTKSGSKTDRHISMQQYINNKLITFPYGAPHIKMCIDHMVKINAAGSQRRSDIADTVFDAVRMVFQDRTALHFIANTADKQEYAKKIIRTQGVVNSDRANVWG
jgi:phage terminase large subunit-like protein